MCAVRSSRRAHLFQALLSAPQIFRVAIVQEIRMASWLIKGSVFTH